MPAWSARSDIVESARANALRGGHTKVEFRLGESEPLPVADASVNVVISNCVLNLSPEKGRVLAEIWRAEPWRPVGELGHGIRGRSPTIASVEPGCRRCVPVQALEQFRIAGFTDVRITLKRPYPESYTLSDPSG